MVQVLAQMECKSLILKLTQEHLDELEEVHKIQEKVLEMWEAKQSPKLQELTIKILQALAQMECKSLLLKLIQEHLEEQVHKIQEKVLEM